MKSILDPSFQYTPSGQTDVRKTFARILQELRGRQQAGANFEPGRAIADAEPDSRSIGVLPAETAGVLLNARSPHEALHSSTMQVELAAGRAGF